VSSEGSEDPSDSLTEDDFSQNSDASSGDSDQAGKGAPGTAGGGGAFRGGRADRSMAQLIDELELWHSPSRVPYATIRISNHHENWPIESARFKAWLRWRSMQRGERLGTVADLEKVIGGLAATAIFSGPEYEIWVRVGELNGTTFVDLGDDDWRCVEIPPADMESDERWFVRDTAPIKFVRRPTMRAMAVPVPGGSIDQLRGYLNVENEGSFRLAVGWMLACFRPRGPFPILIIGGTQGSGKSTLLRLLSRLCDPTQAPERNLPKDERDLFVAAMCSHLQTFDNLSGINAGMSDALCRIATGGGYSARALHTDGEEFLLQACKPIMLNGISDLARRGDVADRSIQVTAARLSADKRLPEEEFWNRFAEDEPMILGVLFDAVAWSLRTYASTPAPAVRMADAARFMEAAAESLGWEKGTFAQLLRENKRQANEIVIESDPFSAALVDLLEEKDGDWRGSTTELLTTLTERVSDKIRRSKMWPISSSGARAGLDRTRDAVESAGFTFERGHEGPKRARRFIQFARLPEEHQT